MKAISFLTLLTSVLVFASACTPNRGCIEPTADNYDQAAEENDGTCIPSRDKMIGTFTYTRVWTDVLLEKDTADVGALAITEGNTAINAFNMNLNQGQLILFGNTSAYTITFIQKSETDTFAGQSYDRTYYGSGTWLDADTVDFQFTLNTQVPTLDGSNNVVTIPQTYNYYCTKKP